MSSTSRGAERAGDDQYFTRWPTALAICERLLDDQVIVPGGAMLEPSCGKGAFLGALAQTFAPEQLHALDLDPSLLLPEYASQAHRIWTHDFRLWTPADETKFDAIVGNPPFSQAEEHIEHACSLLSDAPTSAVIFLLRVNFLAGIERCAGIFTKNPPEFVYVLDKRPAFMDVIDKKGKVKKNATDSCEYGAFVFRKHKPEFEPVVRFLAWKKYRAEWEYSVERQVKQPKKTKPKKKRKSA